jgi:hypothetical protein
LTSASRWGPLIRVDRHDALGLIELQSIKAPASSSSMPQQTLLFGNAD